MNILTNPQAFEIRSSLRDEYGRKLSEWSPCSASVVLWETNSERLDDNVEWRLCGDTSGHKTPSREELAQLMKTIC